MLTALRHCDLCILPDTRPGLTIGEDGICSACRLHGKSVDWEKRAREFAELAREARRCVVPVSGGKDSHWQVIKCLEVGLEVLAVSWKSPARTELGRKNLENLISLGVDHIDFSVNPDIERRFMLDSFEQFGTPMIPMHLAIYNLPTRIAKRFGIPLVVWGEDSASEYCGDERMGIVDEQWLRRYGATHGTTGEDAPSWVYRPIAAPSVKRVFLGWYFRWDPAETAQLAIEHGFTVAPEPRVGFYNAADIDDDFISIHHWMKERKFGFTRVHDNLSLEIRNGRMTRERALEIVDSLGDQTPHEDIERFCEYVGISRERFDEIAGSFR